MKESVEEIESIKPGYSIETADGTRTVAYIYNKTPNYVIFEIKETGVITYKTAANFPDNTHSIALKLDKVETYLDSDRKLWNKYRNTMADVYFLCLSEDKETKLAEQLLDSIMPELELHIFGYSKIYYLIPCLITVTFFVLLSLAFSSYNHLVKVKTFDSHYINVQVLLVLHIVTFGGIGGLFSIAVNIDKHQEKISSRVKWGAHSFAGVFRILIAMLSGLILYVILQSNLITLGFQKNACSEYENFVYYAFAILAGFSQNFVPNLMRKVETTSMKIEIPPSSNNN